jgi:hypothetical protein
MTISKKACKKKVPEQRAMCVPPPEDDKPKPDDPKWTDFVLGHLELHEIKNGNPTVDGLRRITGLVYGDIIYSDTELLEVPQQTYKKCTAKHKMVLKRYSDGEIVEVSAVVDVRYDRTEAPYNEYLVATADTRAEGKALRRILKLSIITAEEVSNKDETDIDDNTFINDNQINMMNLLCKRLDINPVALINNYIKDAIKSINEIPYSKAQNILSDLSHYQRNMRQIPEDLIGYTLDWREKIYAKSRRTRKSKSSD